MLQMQVKAEDEERQLPIESVTLHSEQFRASFVTLSLDASH